MAIQNSTLQRRGDCNASSCTVAGRCSHARGRATQRPATQGPVDAGPWCACDDTDDDDLDGVVLARQGRATGGPADARLVTVPMRDGRGRVARCGRERWGCRRWVRWRRRCRRRRSVECRADAGLACLVPRVSRAFPAPYGPGEAGTGGLSRTGPLDCFRGVLRRWRLSAVHLCSSSTVFVIALTRDTCEHRRATLV